MDATEKGVHRTVLELENIATTIPAIYVCSKRKLVWSKLSMIRHFVRSSVKVIISPVAAGRGLATAAERA